MVILLVCVYGNLTSQTFQDTSGCETIGDFTSKWERIKGIAQVVKPVLKDNDRRKKR
jgi:hypothetical protein